MLRYGLEFKSLDNLFRALQAEITVLQQENRRLREEIEMLKTKKELKG